VNIIGTIHGMFNSASNVAEVRRLIEEIGAGVNLFFPMGSQLADTDRLSDADANVCMCIAYEFTRIRAISGSAWAHQNQGEGVTQKAGTEADILASFAPMH
jgi:nitrogenase molybdenum-iron protein alpha/beta subunit